MIDVLPYGRHAWLLAGPDAEAWPPHAVAQSIRRALHGRPDLASDIVDIVPGAETVVVIARATMSASTGSELNAVFASLDVGMTPSSTGPEREHVIDVVYDGPDLDEVAGATGATRDDVASWHSSATYRCEFCGFAPGFAYLSGLDERLRLPRRTTPRTSVMPGSVAVAGPYSAVYPSASPGGWHLLGRTPIAMWDLSRPDPALVAPGDTVRFRSVDRLDPEPSVRRFQVAATPVGRFNHGLEVVAAGLATTVQDEGRPGLAAVGVPRAGSIDPRGRDLVNRLVGNSADAAVLETAGGLVLRAIRALVVADTASGTVTSLGAGRTMRIEPPAGETWTTVAVRGGIDVPGILGSRSMDTLSGLGPPRPDPGDRLGVGPDPRTPIPTDLAPPRRVHVAGTVRRIGVRLGPRADWFTAEAISSLTARPWVVSAQVSRVGMRLDGPVLSRAPHVDGRELPSEGLVTGAIQVPPDGRPVVMLVDHPTTGGYPVIAVVDPADLALISNSPPGSTIHFTVPVPAPSPGVA